MKNLYFIAFLLFVVANSFAQRQNVYFLKNDGRRVDIRDSADFIRIVREPDSGSVLYNVVEFYPKGQKKLIGKSSKIDPIKLEGPCMVFYVNGNKQRVASYKQNDITGDEYAYFPNGRLYTEKTYILSDSTDKYSGIHVQDIVIKSCFDSTGNALVTDGKGHYVAYDDKFKQIAEEGTVKNGKKTGEWKGSDEDGKIHFTETYENGKLISGTATDNEGTYTYHERATYPRYKGGMAAFLKYVAENTYYPYMDRQKGVQGTVLLSFIVTKTGSITNIKLLRKVSPKIDEEAIRVLAKSKDWLPAVAFGRQVNASYIIPMTFRL